MRPLSRAAIIAVGSEMLTPSRIDTNSLFITGQLNVLGIEVVFKTIVGDDRGGARGLFPRRAGTRGPGCLQRRPRTDRR